MEDWTGSGFEAMISSCSSSRLPAQEPARLPQLPQAHGVLVLNKPRGPSSARCLTALKRLGQKKIGHAGTLDPMASGVLLVLLGHATKISGHLLTDGGKVYSGALRIGESTDTWDAEGAVVTTSAWDGVTEDAVRREIARWRGVSEQPVPPYSAAKHQGQPLYKLARAGKAAPEKVKRIEISHAETLEVSLPHVRFRVSCSSGTYIRSLAHSLGMRLGCGAVLTELTREYSHPFGLDVSHTLEEIAAAPERLPEWVLPVTRALPHWPVFTLGPEEEGRLRNGVSLPCGVTRREGAAAPDICPGEKAVLQARDGSPLALVQAASAPRGLVWTVVRGLWTL